jgi:hypothetical protein
MIATMAADLIMATGDGMATAGCTGTAAAGFTNESA